MPLKITVAGQPAQIDSVKFSETFDPMNVFIASVIYDPNEVVLGYWPVFATELINGALAELYLSVPLSVSPSSVDLQWTTLVPKMGPATDSSLYPVVVGESSWITYTPTLVDSCCKVPGDSNGNGSVNIADATYLLAYTFTGGPAYVCQDEADSNGDGNINIADVTYLIAYIFSGGAAPICGSTGI